MLATLAGVRQILTFTATRLVGLSPENGKLLWELPWGTGNQASQPLITGPDRVFISTGTDAAMSSSPPAPTGSSPRESCGARTG